LLATERAASGYATLASMAGERETDAAMHGGETGVLVLNQNFEPLNICDLRRGLSLLLLEKAEVVTYSPRTIVSSEQEFAVPSVLRLRRQIKRPLPKLRITRRSVLARDDYTCQYCGDKSNLTLDHVFPRHRGGETTWENVVCCCQPCNNRKGNRTPQECNMRLPHPPRRPRFVPFISFPRFISALRNPEWEPFLEGYGKGLER
jgi:5-methylcytosine-specific restriction endonuclease McrA